MSSRTFKQTTGRVSHEGERLGPPCGVLMDLCALKLWQTQPDGKLVPLGDADTRIAAAMLAPLFGSKAQPLVGSGEDGAEWLTAEQAAPLMGVTPQYLYRRWRKFSFAKKFSPKCLRFSKRGILETQNREVKR